LCLSIIYKFFSGFYEFMKVAEIALDFSGWDNADIEGRNYKAKE